MLKKYLVGAAMLILFAAPVFADDMDATGPAPEAAAAPAAKPMKKAKKAHSTGDEAGIEKEFAKFSQAWADGDAKARAACFTYDATLINPFGVAASGRAEIEKLFEQENATIAKGTTQTFDNFKIHFVMPNFALVDCDGTISGAKTPDGADAPDVKLHVYGVVVNRGGKGWQMFAARPAIYAAMPGAAPAADAATDATTPPESAVPEDTPVSDKGDSTK